MTNADKIRAMSDEELATFLSEGWYHQDYENGDYDQALYNWLKQEIKTETTT